MEEGKGERYLAPGHQYGNALLGVRNQEEEAVTHPSTGSKVTRPSVDYIDRSQCANHYTAPPPKLHCMCVMICHG